MSEFSIDDDTQHMDLNHDGVNDDVTVHQDGGTTYLAGDTNGDGTVDTVAVDGPDSGDDGAVDAVYYDTDGDGRADVADVDTDHDGTLDTRYVDDDGDGRADTMDDSAGATDSDPFSGADPYGS